MAQQVEVRWIDDLDGSEAAETVRFALDGSTYEADLSAENAASLRAALQPFTEVARSVRAARKPAPATDRVQNTLIREWARAQGIQISNRGRIPIDVQLRYEHASA